MSAMWPRCRLTKEEAEYVALYSYPGGKPAIKRRSYSLLFEFSGTNLTIKQPLQISRRAKWFALTGAGDIEQMTLEIQTATGEFVTAGPTHLGTMLLGPARSPLSELYVTYDGEESPVHTSYTNLYVQDPALELAPNETLNFIGAVLGDPAVIFALQSSMVVELFAHVWEYPGMYGGPL